MFQKLKNIYRIIFSLQNIGKAQSIAINEQKILAAKTLINCFNYNTHLPLSDYEFKVFSQWGDDGIIQYLINTLDIPNKTFIEFGVENYEEANTRFLLINNNWSGLIIDGSRTNIDEVKKSELYWKYDLKAVSEFITTENINNLFLDNGFKDDIGILSVDIDGNDYWVWKTINSVSPVIVVAEYNSVFGSTNPWSIPYQSDFVRGMAHYSNLYYGSSLQSLCDLAQEKGYSFVGCNIAGNNAYFVRQDKIGKLRPINCEEGFVESKFKESRNQEGNLNYLSGNDRLKSLKGMPVFNTRTNITETI